MSRSGRALETDVFFLTEGKPEPALQSHIFTYLCFSVTLRYQQQAC